MDASREILKRIQDKRADIEKYIRRIEPSGNMLVDVSSVCGVLTVLFTAGPAAGGQQFTEHLQNFLTIPKASTVWQGLCLLALICSAAATIATQMYKSRDIAARLVKLYVCRAKLEGLELGMKTEQIPAKDALVQFNQAIEAIDFVPRPLRKGK